MRRKTCRVVLWCAAVVLVLQATVCTGYDALPFVSDFTSTSQEIVGTPSTCQQYNRDCYFDLFGCFCTRHGSSWSDLAKATNWNTGGAASSSSTYCTSDWLVCRDFSYSPAIDTANALFGGLIAEVNARTNRASQTFKEVKVHSNNSPQGSNKASGTHISSSGNAVQAFGSTTDNWGLSWSLGDFAQSSFGIGMYAGDRAQWQVEGVRVKITQNYKATITGFSGPVSVYPQTVISFSGAHFSSDFFTSGLCHFGSTQTTTLSYVSSTEASCPVPNNAGQPSNAPQVSLETSYLPKTNLPFFVEYPSATPLSIQAISPNVVGVDRNLNDSPVLTLELVGDVLEDATWSHVAFVEEGKACSDDTNHVLSAAVTSATAVFGGTTVFATLQAKPAARYELCYTVNGDVELSGYVKQTSANSVMTVLMGTSDTIAAVTPSAFGEGTNVAVRFTSNTGVLASATTRIGLDTGDCSAYAGPGTLIDDDDAVYDFGAGWSAGDLSVCLSVDPGVWVRQTLVTVTVAAPALSTLAPTTWGGGTTPVLSLGTIPVVFPGTYLGLVIDGETCGAGTILAPTKVMSSNAQLTLAAAVTPTAPSQLYHACVSVRGGAGGTYASVGHQVTITSSNNAVSGVSPQIAYEGLAVDLVISGVTATPTTVIKLAQGTCSGVDTVFSLATSATVSTTLGDTGTWMLCLSTDNGANWAQQIPTVMVRDPTDTDVIARTSSYVVPEDASFTLTVTSSADISASSMALALPGACSPESSHLTTLSPSLSQTTSVSLPSHLAPPSTVVAICFRWAPLLPWVEQTDQLLVLLQSPLAITAISPAIFSNGTAPTFEATGALVNVGAQLALALPGQCESGPQLGAQTFGSVQSITLSSVIITEEGTNGAYDVCYSVDAGVSWVTQILVPVRSTSDPFALKVQTSTPTVVGVGQTQTFTVTATPGNDPHPTNGLLALATDTDCATRFSQMSFTASGTAPNAMTEGISTTGTYVMCYSEDAGATWAPQAAPSASVFVISATAKATAASSVTSIGVGVSSAFSVTRASSQASLACSTCRVAWAPLASGCASGRVNEVSLPWGPVNEVSVDLGSLSFGTPGTYALCYTVSDGASWTAQDDVTLRVLAASTTSVSDVQPPVWGAAMSLEVALVGPRASPWSRVAFGLGGSCASPLADTLVTEDDPTVIPTPPLSAGTYSLCYSTNNGSSWSVQDAQVTVLPLSGGIVSAVTPTSMGSNTRPTMTLAGITPSVGTQVAFVVNPGDCNTINARLGVTVVAPPVANPVTLDVPVTQSNSVPLHLCVSVNGGLAWARQTFGTVDIVAANEGIVSGALVPAVVARGRPVTLDITQRVTPTTRIAFSPTASCASALLLNEVATPVQGAPVTLPGAFLDPGTYVVCASVDNGSYWVPQTFPELSVVVAAPDDLVALSPALMGAGDSPTFALSGTLVLTEETRIAFSTNGDCTPADMETEITLVSALTGLSFDAPGTLTPPATTVYTMCLTVDGGASWVAQSSPGTRLHVEVATPSSITALSWDAVGENAFDFALLAYGPTASPTSEVAFDRTTACAGGGVEMAVPFTLDVVDAQATPAVSFNITSPGLSGPTGATYDLCYRSSPAVAWQRQTSIGRVSLARAIPGSLNATVPTYVPPGLLADIRIRADLAVAPWTPTTWVGYAAVGGAGCATPAAVEVQGPLDPENIVAGTDSARFPMATAFASPGMYDVCLSVDNGGSWAASGTLLRVGGVLNTSVETISPTVIQREETTVVIVDGIVPAPGIRLAFVPAAASDPLEAGMAGDSGVCDTLGTGSGYSANDTSVLEVTLSTGGVHTLCVSNDGGNLWIEQVLPGSALTVLDCVAQTSCSSCRAEGCGWCVKDETCSLSPQCPDFRVCDSCTAPLGQATCPSFSAAPGASLFGVYTGGETTAFESDMLDDATDNYECEFTVDNTVLATRVPATITGPGTLECTAPASRLGVLGADIRLYRGDNLYTAADQVVDYDYYRCDTQTQCTGCWDATARPQCGFCQQTQACASASVCMAAVGENAIWTSGMDGGTCPVVSSVEPNSGPAYGGTTITVTTSDLYPELSDATRWECEFGSGGARANATILSDSTLTCRTPAVPASEVAVRVLANGVLHTPGTSAGALYAFQGSSQFIAPPPPSNTPMIAGIVGALLCLLLVALVVLGVIWKRQRDFEEMVKPPTLTQAMREQIAWGAPPVLNPEDRRLLPFMREFVDEIVMDYEMMGIMGDVTQSTEIDRITRAINIIYEARHQSLDILLYMVSREVRISLSQSTLFRTNSFATKLFKTFSKMKGVDFLHAALGRIINVMLLEADEDEVDVSALKNKNNALERFALLTKCQKLFLQIKESEWRVPNEFRILFQHVQGCMRERYPIDLSSIGEYVATELSTGLATTSHTYQQGNDTFEQLQSLAPHIRSDMEALGTILGPVSGQVERFETTVNTLESQLQKMLATVDKLKGALDPSSNQGQRILQEHQQKQNSVAVGGFFFLRFLVPALTAPEAFHLVHEPPFPNGRKLLVMIGKVIQNLSNNIEFGGKEAHMAQLNDFIISNQGEITRLFDKLSTVRQSSPGQDISETLEYMDVPLKYLEGHTVNLYKHAVSIRQKFVDFLVNTTEINDEPLSELAIQQRQQAATRFEAILDAIATQDAAANAGKLNSWIRNTSHRESMLSSAFATVDDGTGVGTPHPGMSSSSDSLDDSDSGVGPQVDLLGGDVDIDLLGGGGVPMTSVPAPTPL